MDTRLEIVLAAKDVTGRAFSKVQNRIKRLSKAMFSLQGAMVGVAGVAGIGYFIKKNLEAADVIAKTADTIGITTRSLQEYRFMAERAGVSTQQVETGMSAFVKRIGELKVGTGALSTYLKKNNEALAEQLKNARSTDEALNIFLNTLAGLTSQSDKAALSAAAFSRTAGIKMTNLVKGGTAAIAGMRKEFKDLGLEIDENLLRHAEETIDKFTNLEFVLKQRLMSTVLELAPEISKIAEGMTTWVIANDDLIKQDLPRYFKDLAKTAKFFGAILSGVINKIEQVGHGFQMIKGFFVEGSKSPHLYDIPSRPGDPGTPDTLNISKNFGAKTPFVNWDKLNMTDKERKMMFIDDDLVQATQDKLDEMADAGVETADIWANAFDGWANNFSQTLTDMIWESDFSFKSIARSYGKMLTEMLMQENVVKPSMGIFNKLFSSVDWGGALGGLFGGSGVSFGASSAKSFSMAGGGVINEHVVGVGTSSGMSYEFGESGTEMVLPAGSGGGVTNINIMAVDSKSFDDMVQRNPASIITTVERAMKGNTGMRQIMRGTI